jgi:hypothetical protein
MTVQDILDKIERNKTWTWFSPEEQELIVSELGKQIPKKPIVECFSMGYRRCPNCGEYFDCDEDYYLENGDWHYCGKCGQAIEWGEEDD